MLSLLRRTKERGSRSCKLYGQTITRKMSTRHLNPGKGLQGRCPRGIKEPEKDCKEEEAITKKKLATKIMYDWGEQQRSSTCGARLLGSQLAEGHDGPKSMLECTWKLPWGRGVWSICGAEVDAEMYWEITLVHERLSECPWKLHWKGKGRTREFGG